MIRQIYYEQYRYAVVVHVIQLRSCIREVVRFNIPVYRKR